MPKVAVYNLEGSQTGELTLSDEIFASDIDVYKSQCLPRADRLKPCIRRRRIYRPRAVLS